MKTLTNTNVTPNNVLVTRRFGNRTTAARIVNAYRNGESMDILAADFGSTAGAIRTLLVLNRIRIRPRGRYARDQFINA